jgi:hypothetical protein
VLPNQQTPLQKLLRLRIIQAEPLMYIPVELADQIIQMLADIHTPLPPAAEEIYTKEHLTKTESLLLDRLLQHPGYVVETAQLITYAHLPGRETLWVHLHRIREKLNDGYTLLTVQNQGYLLELSTSPLANRDICP